ncbi:Uncharacterised protein [Chlamydia trachomatis]|nr:Uncharacterised protein [Chlamydia trachomatis]
MTNVLTGSRSKGGIVMRERSRAPDKERYRVLGIGVAETVRQSIVGKRSFRESLAFTPKRCSSSIISRPGL